jgi:hypothetical protein
MFVEIGGRLMIDSQGRFVTGISASQILSAGPGQASRHRIALRFDEAARARGSTIRLKHLVAKLGRPVNGWLVLGGDQ